MTATRIRLDYALAMADGVGDGGLTESALDALEPRFARAHAAVLARCASNELGFFALPSEPQALGAVRRVRAALHSDTRDVLLLGIGGSSLGARALLEALCEPQHLGSRSAVARPRLHLPDNSDPWLLSHLLTTLDPATTAVLVISKSGSTVETAAQLLIVREWLERGVGKDGLRTRICAITDPSQGSLRALAESERWLSLPIPSNVGGRFSILTAVGLLPACLLDIDAQALLEGAANMAERCKQPSLRDNPAGVLAAVHYLHHTLAGHGIHVMMPYSDRLRAFAAWYVQLWAESLGKRVDRDGRTVESGPTPVPAVGTTDQHAQVQLFIEGPRDKLVTFIAVEQTERDLVVPSSTGADAYLGGITLARLLDAERQGTTEALAADRRPSVTLTLERLDASAFGGLLFLYEAATAFAGELYGVNAFDQPGVELGKRLAFGLLGREGYAQAAAELRAQQARRSTRFRLE
ncbi:MAG: glucose-6-phosphate isomerase [Polyangiales bacterium]